MADYRKVLTRKELTAGELRTVMIEDREIVIANIGGEFFAMDNACPHRGAPLGEGYTEGDHIVCLMHGFKFHARTGVDSERDDLRTRTYPVRVEGEDILVLVE